MKGLLIGAPNSGSGKTVLTLAMLRALKNTGIHVSPVKAGPDFIDPAFHTLAAGVQSLNLDAWAMRPELIQALAKEHSANNKTLIVEGVMGLYDGAANGVGASADLANMLSLPIILVVDCARQSHSIAALVLGFKNYRNDVKIKGLILNKVGSARHEAMLRQSLEPLDIPVLGAIHRNDAFFLAERHLGLVQACEISKIDDFIENAANIFAQCVDLNVLIDLSQTVHQVNVQCSTSHIVPLGQHIAVSKDEAFAFCYQHLLEGWQKSGATISFFSPLHNEVPDKNADAVYLCGGYPELYAEQLANAHSFKKAMRNMAEEGKIIYGECGGYITLGEWLEDKNGKKHEMLSLLPLKTSFSRKKLHLGYRQLTPVSNFIWNKPLRGHEFHYVSIIDEKKAKPLFHVRDALDNNLGTMGVIQDNVAGSFIHIIDCVM